MKKRLNYEISLIKTLDLRKPLMLSFDVYGYDYYSNIGWSINGHVEEGYLTLLIAIEYI